MQLVRYITVFLKALFLYTFKGKLYGNKINPAIVTFKLWESSCLCSVRFLAGWIFIQQGDKRIWNVHKKYKIPALTHGNFESRIRERSSSFLSKSVSYILLLDFSWLALLDDGNPILSLVTARKLKIADEKPLVTSR